MRKTTPNETMEQSRALEITCPFCLVDPGVPCSEADPVHMAGRSHQERRLDASIAWRNRLRKSLQGEP